MYELTLTQINVQGLSAKTYRCTLHQITDVVRVGRDPQHCDLVLTEPTVSRTHIEIFFKPNWQRFYVRNLQPKNPPLINGGLLIEGEAALSLDSVIQLGQLELKLTQIQLIGAAGSVNPSGQPIHQQSFSLEATGLPPSQFLGVHQAIGRVAESAIAPHIPSASPVFSTPQIPSTPPSSSSSYGLECPKCQSIHPLGLRNSACPSCGHFLADAESILVMAGSR